MIRGTTPTLEFSLEDFDVTTIEELYITFKQQDKVILEKDKDDCTITTNKITVSLSQEDTLLFSILYQVEIQMRVLLDTEDALASQIWSIPVERILKDGTI